MNTTLNLQSPWSEVKEKIKEINISISDEDLEYQPGQEDQLFQRLSQKLNMDIIEVKGWIESVSANKGKAS